MTLSRVMEWSRAVSDKRWVNIEHNMSSTQLGHIIWNPPQYRLLGTKTSELTRITLKLWDKTHSQNNWDYNSPLIYLKDNKFFEPGIREVGGNWIKNGNAQLKDIIKKGKICTYHALRLDTDFMVIDAWRYNQLSHFVEKLPKPIRGEEDYRPLEQLCRRETTKNNIS